VGPLRADSRGSTTLAEAIASSGSMSGIAVLGGAVNTIARPAGLGPVNCETRTLNLKGRSEPVEVRVLYVAPGKSTQGGHHEASRRVLAASAGHAAPHAPGRLHRPGPGCRAFAAHADIWRACRAYHLPGQPGCP
jgi:hypothetical protein